LLAIYLKITLRIPKDILTHRGAIEVQLRSYPEARKLVEELMPGRLQQFIHILNFSNIASITKKVLFSAAL
jgi:hypothetical protein